MQQTRQLIESIEPGQSVGIWIGPEGGFEEAEVEKIVEQGGKSITLGHRILRTETAGMTALSILMYHLEK
jgi:16S rRNA (uracil1498-N3)-methyltransferase